MRKVPDKKTLYCLDVFSKRTRKKVHRWFYRLGCFLQHHYWKILLLSAIALLIPCLIGLKHLKLETDVEKLWVSSGDRLKKENEYTQKYYGGNGFGEDEIGSEVIIQVAKNENENILTKENLLEHLDILRSVMKLKVNIYFQEWGLEDFCTKYTISNMGMSSAERSLIEALNPCVIMTPLDCFWEGSYVLDEKKVGDAFSWRKQTLLEGIFGTYSRELISPRMETFIHEIGASYGYRKKPCLNPKDPDCPSYNASYAKIADIGAELTGGCYGLAKNYMHWPETALVSGVHRNGSGFIKSAKALQSVIQIINAEQFYDTVSLQKRSDTSGGFTRERAEHILHSWKKAFSEYMNERGRKPKLNTKMMAFSTASFDGLVENFSKTDSKKLIIGIAILICYALLTLKRWTSSVFSYGMMGVLGVVFVCYGIAAGIGLSQFLQIKLTVVSTQVLPFLALGLGLDNMFLLVRTYVFVCDSGEIPHKKIIGVCLGECGLSMTMTAIVNICAFMVASLIPIVALQEFSRQAAVVVFVNWFTLMFALTPFLCFDVERQINKRSDCFCMRDDDEEEDTIPQTNPKDNTNIETKFSCNFPGSRNSPEVTAEGSVVAGTIPSNIFTINRSNSNVNKPKPKDKFALNRAKSQFNVTPQTVNDSKQSKQPPGKWTKLVGKLSLNYFAHTYFSNWIIMSRVKTVVLIIDFALVMLAGYGATLVKDDLNIAEMVPKNTPPYEFLTTQRKYFSFYEFHVITQDFDYANNQQLVYDFYGKLSELDYVVKLHSKTEPRRLWLKIFSNWLKERENIFRNEWRAGNISHKCIPDCVNASTEAKTVYRLLNTRHRDDPVDRTKPFSEVLVYRNGTINPKWFYLALNLWYWSDNLGAAKVSMRPSLNELVSYPNIADFNDQRVVKPKFINMPFFVHGLKTTDEYVGFLESVRVVCEEFASKGLPSYPMGTPFTYWEQFTFLRKYLLKAGGIVLLVTWLLIIITIMSVKAAFMVIIFMMFTSFEIYGFIGLLGLNLNAIPVVILIMSVGIGIEFSLHTVSAFVNTPGDRNTRTKGALEITFAATIDGALSTLVMVGLLSSSQYEFVTRYFYFLVLILIFVSLINGLFVLPVMLSIFGPCCEVSNRAIRPKIPPALMIPLSIKIEPMRSRNITPKLKTRPKMPPSCRKSPTLTTISERTESRVSKLSRSSNKYDNDSSSVSSKHSVRPGTPCYNDNQYRQTSVHNYENENSEYHEIRSPDNTRTRPAWHHAPKLCETNDSLSSINTMSGHSLDTYREIATCSRVKKGNRPPTGAPRSNPSRRSEQYNNNNSNSGASRDYDPRVIQVHSRDDNRTTTKVKATISIEVETSHPMTTSQYDGYDDDDGLPVIDC